MVVTAAHEIGPPALLALLADGEIHSGVRLAAALGVTRAAVWKGIGRLRALSIGVEAVARRGYRLTAPVELLDADRIHACLSAANAARLATLELPFTVDSTNSRLLAATPPACGRALVCATELQRAGRGRRGRAWLAPFGAGITLSVGWSFRAAHRDLAALSLAAGVAIATALARCGLPGIRLKWPNDLWLGERKLGGVLIELRAEVHGPAYVVIGIGLNVALSAASRAAIEAGGVSVAAVADALIAPPSRNQLVGTILEELFGMLSRFAEQGFAPFHAPWSALDALRGRRVRIISGERQVTGVSQGIDPDGTLVIAVGKEMRRFTSGEVSLRLEGESA